MNDIYLKSPERALGASCCMARTAHKDYQRFCQITGSVAAMRNYAFGLIICVMFDALNANKAEQ